MRMRSYKVSKKAQIDSLFLPPQKEEDLSNGGGRCSANTRRKALVRTIPENVKGFSEPITFLLGPTEVDAGR
jgi:hypothetical protein